jgi:hypothetical protein
VPRREREELERVDADFVPRCDLLRRPLVLRRDFELRLEREREEDEREEDELLPRDLDVDLRVAILSSLLHTQTTECAHGLRSTGERLYRS